MDLDYTRGDFGFTSREKKDIELFAYIRHALQHQNGAYYGYRSIDHVYGGTAFRSKGQEGMKIEVSPELAYRMVRDIEALTSKAWTNHKARRGTLGLPISRRQSDPPRT